MAAKIYVTQPIPEKALARLRAAGSVEINPDSAHIVTKPELIAALKRNEYLFCLLHDRVDGEVIHQSPNLKLISTMAVNPATIDVAAATARRIPVTANPPLSPRRRRIFTGDSCSRRRDGSWKATARSAPAFFPAASRCISSAPR